eukprot:gene27820-34600_t
MVQKLQAVALKLSSYSMNLQRLKEELRSITKVLNEAQQNKLSDSVQAELTVKKLEAIIDSKEVEVLRLKSSMEWANERIMQLELSLQKATMSLGSREEITSKWEMKTGELQQKIVELEKIRKALTTQLHSLRQELGPKEEKLIKVSEKLQEMDREYELSLHALSEKDKDLSHKGNSVGLLQKQVRELRNNANRKDAALRRAATLFDEYRFALQQAYYISEKRTLIPAGPPGTATQPTESSEAKTNNGKFSKTLGIAANSMKPDVEVVEIIAQNNGMKTAMKRLNDILTPYLVEGTIDAEMLDDIEAVKIEQDRHMHLLHSNVTGLRTNLDVINKVAATKVHNHLADNQNLLKEVNNLRSEVRAMSLDNQRLQAHSTDRSSQMQHSQSAHAIEPVDSLDSFNRETSQLTSSFQEYDSLQKELAMNPYKQQQQVSESQSLASLSRNQSAPGQLQQQTDSTHELNRRLSSLSALNPGGVGHNSTTGMTAAESKIAALIEMNVQEINALKSNEQAALSTTSGGKVKKSASSRDPLTGHVPKSNKKSSGSGANKSHTASSLSQNSSLVEGMRSLDMGSFVSDGSAGSAGLKQMSGSKTLGNATFLLPPVHNKNK